MAPASGGRRKKESKPKPTKEEADAEKARLVAKLEAADVRVPAKISLPRARLLCEEHGLVEPEYIDSTKITVVKSALRAAMTLTGDQFEAFHDLVERYVFAVSKMLRRGSIAFLYHMLRVRETEGIQALPDAFREMDTYWKRWLQLRVTGLDQTWYPEQRRVLVSTSMDVREDGTVAFGIHVLLSADQTVQEILGDLGTEVFEPRFKVVTKKEGREVSCVVRLERQPPFFDQVLAYAAETFETCVANTTWVPLFARVGRLVKAEIRAAALPKEQRPHMSRVMHFIRSSDGQIPQDFHPFVRDLVADLRRRLGADGQTWLHDEWGHKKMTFHQVFAFNLWMQQRFKDLGQKQMRLLPVFDVGRVHVRLDKRTLTAALERVLGGRLPQGGVAACFKRHRGKSQWNFDGSIMTDGVAVSVQYSKTVKVRKNVPKKPRKCKASAADQQSNGDDDDMVTDQPTVLFINHRRVVVIGIDPGRSNMFMASYWDPDTCGNSKRAEEGSVRQQKDKVPHRRTWSLSGGEYRHKSGIRARCKRTADRYAPLQATFADLTNASLRPLMASEVAEYLHRAAPIREQWWALALRPNMARDAFRVFKGRNQVLDGAFSKLKRQVQAKYPGYEIHIAYGEAGLTMSPTGPGEVAVPTSETYRACVRVFGKGFVHPVDECNTTRISWGSGAAKELVYRRIMDERGKTHTLEHTSEKKAPFTKTLEETRGARAWIEASKAKAKRRRGGKDPPPQYGPQEDPARPIRCPDVRGLRFCPERRKLIDRDLDAALTIARLYVLELLGRPRPRAFCRRNESAAAAAA
jgi:hypothetical protein